MICDRILGQVHDDAGNGAGNGAGNVDWIDIDWQHTARRAMRLRSNRGRQISLLLPRNTTLKHGDIVGYVDAQPLAIRVAPVDLLIFSPQNIEQAAQLSLALGLLHAPTQIVDQQIITLDDGPNLELADRLQIPFTRLRQRFHPQPDSVLFPLHDQRPPAPQPQ